MTTPARPTETAEIREALAADIGSIIRSNVSVFLGGVEGIDDAASEVASAMASLFAQLDEAATAQAERTAGELAAAEARIAVLEAERNGLRDRGSNLALAFFVLSESGHGGAMHDVRTWAKGGFRGAIPCTAGALFHRWAAENGIVIVDGFMRAARAALTEEPPHAE